VHLCECEFGQLSVIFRASATARTKVTVVIKHTGKFTRCSVMIVTYALGDLLYSASSYNRERYLARRVCSCLLSAPSAHFSHLERWLLAFLFFRTIEITKE
jgi:hypothetical protein